MMRGRVDDYKLVALGFALGWFFSRILAGPLVGARLDYTTPPDAYGNPEYAAYVLPGGFGAQTVRRVERPTWTEFVGRMVSVGLPGRQQPRLP